jgi:uncharacterized membrane protein YqjE
MAFFTENPDRAGLAATVGRMADGFSKLVTQHIALAKMELAEDAKALGGELGRMAVFVPFILTGYALLCGALAVLLGTWIGMAGGLAVVGAANVLGGGVGIWRAVNRLRARQMLGGTLEELNRSTTVLTAPNGGRGTEVPHGQ